MHSVHPPSCCLLTLYKCFLNRFRPTRNHTEPHVTIARLLTLVALAGRLYQVEYAMEAINHAGTCIGIKGTDGILLACEKKHVVSLHAMRVNR